MGKYLLQGNYAGDGIKGLLKEGGTRRRSAVEKLLHSVGGSVESMYYAFGESDFCIIVDVPDHVSAIAAILVANASGAVKVRTTVLVSTEDVDRAVNMTTDYAPPGR
ncbi:MAG: GYD domain-containing protein [Gemmatimonadetes bacterium]|nr:GYD domain-containing protein [Gemmatimonadota bacterium]